jgi:hypothetical protein
VGRSGEGQWEASTVRALAAQPPPALRPLLPLSHRSSNALGPNGVAALVEPLSRLRGLVDLTLR